MSKPLTLIIVAIQAECNKKEQSNSDDLHQCLIYKYCVIALKGLLIKAGTFMSMP